MSPVKKAIENFDALDYSAQEYAAQSLAGRGYVYKLTEHHDPCSVTETNQIKSEDQSIGTPDASQRLSKIKMLSSSPSTDVKKSYAKPSENPGELSKSNAKHLGEQKDMMEWLMSTKDESVNQSPSSDSSNLADMPPDLVPGKASSKPRALIMELFQALCYQNGDPSFYEPWSVDENTMQSTCSSTPLTDGSGTGASPKSGTTSSAPGIEGNSKRSHQTTSRSSQEEDGDEPPRKEFRQEQNPSNPDATAALQGRIQMPCPVQEPQKCQGTNATVSELLRSLEVRHRIVICKDCCTKVHVPEEERKPENVRKRHKLETCEPRCIGTTCSGIANDELPHHRRTESCPTWQSLPNEIRWSFIWSVINPGQDTPEPSFCTGVGYEHNTTRRPCKQQSRPRGTDICNALLRDLDERDRQRNSLENELKAANDKIAQQEEKHEKRISSLENIIETLLERLVENNVKVPNSLQKRLQDECPGVFCEPVVQLRSRHSQAPPTPTSIPKSGARERNLTALSTISYSEPEPSDSRQHQSSAMLPQPPRFSDNGSGDVPSSQLDIGKTLPIMA
ncbi:hypothetical protein IL306_014541 [Fusarium sp. DS 682]|nr:hypothetical protein IL306_014541 [Fusarium sp. DS 682]